MGSDCSCISTKASCGKNTEAIFLSPTLKVQSCNIQACPASPTSPESQATKIFALSYLSRFYSQIEHRVSVGVLNLQISLPMQYITPSDEFENPTEIKEDIIYFGQLENNIQQGKGIQVNNDGSIYTGYFAKGKYNGSGRLIQNSEEYYEGLFIDNIPNGHGLRMFPSGKILTGEFKNGIIEGDCKIKWENATYSGGFSEGMRNGRGILIHEDKIYEGKFANDIIEGYGTCI